MQFISQIDYFLAKVEQRITLTFEGLLGLDYNC